MSQQVSVYIEAVCTDEVKAESILDGLGYLGFDVVSEHGGAELVSSEEGIHKLPSTGAKSIAEKVFGVFLQHDPEATCRVDVTYIEQAPVDSFEFEEVQK